MFVACEFDMTSGKSCAIVSFLSCQLLALLLIFLSGCASLPRVPVDNPETTQANATLTTSAMVGREDKGWWQVGFHRTIKDDEDPMWHLDTLIAYEVIKPMLDQQQFTLWRFHRRAAPDETGHMFSFIFYSTRSEAEQVYQLIREHPLVKQLQHEDVIERLSFADINADARVNIEDTSDKNWPIELQKAWPAFIMGVSQTWLNLIGEFVKQSDENNGVETASQIARFKEINAKINSIWELEGSHAFLHHLNALFGYQELYIIERRRTRF